MFRRWEDLFEILHFSHSGECLQVVQGVLGPAAGTVKEASCLQSDHLCPGWVWHGSVSAQHRNCFPALWLMLGCLRMKLQSLLWPWSLKLRWRWGKVFSGYGKCNWFKLLHDCKFWYVQGIFVVILHKEQSSSIRHKILYLVVFEVLDSDTSVKYIGWEVGCRSVGAMSFKAEALCRFPLLTLWMFSSSGVDSWFKMEI